MILLTFDLEEFDIPLEFGHTITFEEQLSWSAIGTRSILSLLRKKNIKATFFITVVFARHHKDLIEEIVADGHEIGSHGWSHSSFEQSDLMQSRLELEKISGKKIHGFRMPRLQEANAKLLLSAGYSYDSSISPTYIPGRYNNLGLPITPFNEDGLRELPVSVTPLIRFPLFWLAFHVLPFSVFSFLCNWTLVRIKYLNLYFHPWEFLEESVLKKYGLPFYIQYNSGEKMVYRLEKLIDILSKRDSFHCCGE